MRAAWLLALLVLALAGCQHVDGPELLTLTELAPNVVSSGDRLDLRGEGFPQGRRATVVFRGELSRPGARPIEGVEIAAAGVAHTSGHVLVALDDTIVGRFVGKGGDALHTTFSGDVRVIFPSRSSMAPSVVGTLRSVTVDFVPTPAGSAQLEHEAEGRRFLSHVGMLAARDADADALAVSAVTPGGAADVLGVREGDLLASLQGVTVRGVGDLSVARGLTAVTLTLVRPGAERPYGVELDVTKLSPPAVASLAPAAVLVLVLVVLIVLGLGPLPTVTAWLRRGVARANRATRSPRSLPAQLLTWLSPDGRRPVGAPLVAFVVTVALFTLLGFGRQLISEDVDLGLLTLSSVVVLVAGRLAEGGLRPGRSWSLLLGARAVLATLAFVVPGLIGLAALVVATESVTLGEMAAAQGGAPWRFWALTNPGLTAGALCLLFSAVPTGVRQSGTLGALEDGGEAGLPSVLVSFARAAEWLHAWLTAGLVVALYLGAWQVPLASALWAPSLGLSALGMVLFVAKLWASMLVIVALRTLLCRLGVETLAGFALTRALPLAALAAGLSVLWAEAADRWELPPAFAGALLTGVALLVTGLVLVRLAAPAPRQALSGSVNPWL